MIENIIVSKDELSIKSQDELIKLFVENIKRTTGFKTCIERVINTGMFAILVAKMHGKTSCVIGMTYKNSDALLGMFSFMYNSDILISIIKQAVNKEIVNVISMAFVNKGYKCSPYAMDEISADILIDWIEL